jgi:Tat protein secretion system quality control protein TatD with DNase activity
VAEVKGVPLEEVLRTVRDNTRTVYGIQLVRV